MTRTAFLASLALTAVTAAALPARDALAQGAAAAPPVALVPQPASVKEMPGTFRLTAATRLIARGEAAPVARRLLGWDEILEGGLAPGAAVMNWRGVEAAVAAAKAGHDVVMAPRQFTYLDYYQTEEDAQAKRPLAIGGLVPLEKVYGFEPVPAGLNPAEAKHILGVQGQLWGEYISNRKKLEYMAFPRACALAEVAWSPKDARDWADFSKRLPAHLKRLDRLDVGYHRKSPR
jgi:N-acetyl-beta-hexosaminidase